MRIDIITCLPQLLESFTAHSILKRGQEKGVITVVLHDLKNFTTDKHRRTDDYAFGGGAGMVMLAEPIANCIDFLKNQRKYDEIIYTTPDGERFEQKTANRLSMLDNIIILCGHYKGVDERIREEYITTELSVGDFVVSGGEIPAALMTDAILRLVPGVMNDETSALTDSFQDNLLAPPVYTRPADFRGKKVPDILISGHEANISDWRLQQSILRTQKRRPDLWEKYKKGE
jgi:tRNA (guanine37-N1)-methyltransferase